MADSWNGSLTARPEGKTWWVWVREAGGWRQTLCWARTQEEAKARARRELGTGVDWQVQPMWVSTVPMDDLSDL
mgnify:FL=1